MTFEIINSGPATGAENMQRDLTLCADVRSGAIPATLRLYTWQPWCVSLGKHQSADTMDQLLLRERGYDIVHRPTGGRAVLHADEVTYCICVPVGDALEARRVYHDVHMIIFKALSGLTEHLSVAGLDADLRAHYASSGPLGQACFSSHARTEILSSGRKVVGSAQRVLDGVVLQHGSILCGNGHEQLADIIIADEDQREKLRSSIMASSTTLSQVASRQITTDDVVTAIMAWTAANGTLISTPVNGSDN
ncbi:MAG: lipoate--protein ligase family protein [Candidatus Kapabacteria bacterium]|nr:lipoate--protein ligase family protein [Candidatus Kapabacteria bacterium]